MKKILKLGAPVFVLLAGIGVVYALNAAKPPPEKKDDALRLISLYVDEVDSESVTLSVKTQGEVRPKTEIDLVPQVTGRVVFVADEFAEGAEFNPNTVLIKIDDADYQLAVIRAEARVAEARTNLERELATAQNKREQWKNSSSKNAPTPFALNETQVAEGRAKVRSAEAELAEARLNLSRTEIKVPFLGRVREKAVGLGQYVTAGTKLGRVFSTDKIEIRLPLTDSQIFELNLPMGFMATNGNGPEVTLTARVGRRDYTWKGHIVRTQAAVDQNTRLIYAIAEVDDPYGVSADSNMPLAVGLFVNAEVVSNVQQNAYTIPRLALRNADKVYVVNDQDKLEIRTVDVLSTTEDRVLLNGGVREGELVVTSTIPAAVDGMHVQPIRREQQG
ncbi:MAG: efflux RND transporter periplasmic adaptor subunit [Xanthomonadales bacterium]|nr:efflux RND transporter periplasmic adaptor subunit [Xanthomonadales bacterium]NNL94366.1 efflux RND transporter periplasmic adaptor subunit [Xanthomonadales bacterium]